MEGDSNGNGGEYREEEALLLKALSETKYKSRDIASALKYALRAFRVFPSLQGIEPLVSSLRILGHAELSPRLQTRPDYYGILQLEPFSDMESVRRQYKSLALMLHPDKNQSFVCQDAFKAVGEALRVLSDSKEKERYDLERRVRMQEEGLGKGGDVGFGSEGRFWSRCRECGKLHDFDKVYAGKRLVCSGCGKTFKAVGLGDGTNSESEETDEDPGIVAGTSSLKKTSGGGDGIVKSGDIIYVRKRKGIANKFRGSGAIGKQMSEVEDGDSGGRVGAKRVKRGGVRACDGYSNRVVGGFEEEEEEEEEEEAFWDLKLKDGLKKAEMSGGWWSEPKVIVNYDETKNDGGVVRTQIVCGLEACSRSVRLNPKSDRKHITRVMEEVDTVVVMGLRCMAEDRLKIVKFSDKGHSNVHQSPKAVVIGGNGEWGGSRRRSLRVMVKSAEESALILVQKDIESGEEVMTLAEMQSKLVQKSRGDRRRTSNHKRKMEKEKKREEAEVKLADEGDENEDERVVKQTGEDGEKELQNNENDAVKENESRKDDGEKEPEKMRKEEGKASSIDEEMGIAMTSADDDDGDDDDEQDQENMNREDQNEMEIVFVVPERSEGANGKGEDQADMSGDVQIRTDGTTEHVTWGNGDNDEETTTDTRWAKRIRCYETKRRALLKRSKDSEVEILETPGPPDHQSGLAIIEKPLVTKSRSARHTLSSNSDFYNFDKDRGERSFKMGQIWAIYDEFGLPRRYGMIEEVVSIHPFAVHLQWLVKQDTKVQDPTASCSACGRFKVTTSTTVQSVGIFSHEVDGDKVARETYDIYPKRDSVWAIYGGSVMNECYDIVVCLTSYIDMFGLSLAYVEKMEGFRSVYKRKEFGWHAVRWLGKDEVFLISHQVPARRLSHEDGSDFEEDCWVLDPASIPPSPMAENLP